MVKLMILEPDLKRDLKTLVDKFGIKQVISSLITICEDKVSESPVDWKFWALNIKSFFGEALKRE